MMTQLQRFRWLTGRLPDPATRRLVALVGARQTGKTTLARSRYEGLRYVNLDAPENREAVRSVPTAGWHGSIGPAILDEAQKEPVVFDKVKYAYDSGSLDFSVLLGSSRFLLMDRVRESLAGRAFVFELWPLMLSEVLTPAGETPDEPLIDRLLTGEVRLDERLGAEPAVLLAEEEARRRAAFEHLTTWGGMPELLRLEEADRREWLRSYQQTFLERDLTDLVRLSDLQPFRGLQRVAMLRSGGLVNYADLARDVGISPGTARQYLEYLRISCQVVLLEPWSTNLTSQVVKAPRLYWIDLGLLRQGTMRWGPLDGAMFETFVVGEIVKRISTLGLEARPAFYRTRSGLEVDLLIETPRGVLGLEVRCRESAAAKDAGAMRRVAEALSDRWLGGTIVTLGNRIEVVDEPTGIWAVPAHRLF